jgi:hypothetical protein
MLLRTSRMPSLTNIQNISLTGTRAALRPVQDELLASFGVIGLLPSLWSRPQALHSDGRLRAEIQRLFRFARLKQREHSLGELKSIGHGISMGMVRRLLGRDSVCSHQVSASKRISTR